MSREKDSKGAKGSASLVVKALTANQQLIRDVANIPFSPVVGLDKKSITTEDTSSDYKSFGLQYVKVLPAIGSAAEVNSAATVAAKAIFASNRRPNSGSVNYEAPDYLMYHVAVYEAFAAIRHFARAYGLFKLYNDRSRILPDKLINACGVSETLINELPSLRAMLNAQILRLNSLNVYSGFPVGATWMSAFNEVYVDSKDPKASLFMIVPEGFHSWNGTFAQTGSCLRVNRHTSVNTSVDGIRQYLNLLIDPLMADQDIAIMSGDTAKAFPNDLYKMQEIGEDYMPALIYDTEMLTQLENLELQVGIKYTNNSGAIFQDASGNIFQTVFAEFGGAGDVLHDHLVNLHWNNPEPKDVVLASRFKQTYADDDAYYLKDDGTIDHSTDFNLRSCADFIVTQYSIQRGGITGLLTTVILDNSDALKAYDIRSVLHATVLDWHPIIQIIYKTHNECEYVGDLDNFTWISDNELKNIHDAITLSMLGVPAMSE